MTQIFKTGIELFILAILSFILSCEVIGTEKNEKIETALLFNYINYSGKITYYVDDVQESYGSYASGFYSSVISSTVIGANSDTIADRYIMISFAISGNTVDDVTIIIADWDNFTWASNRPGGSAIINITKYGEVGDTIEGTFSGTLRNICDCSFLNIENGEFSVKRRADQ